MNELYHHGILGQKWGVRRYQNPDGTLTEAGKRHLQKKDSLWVNRKHKTIERKALKSSRKEFTKYVKKELRYSTPLYNESGTLSSAYMNAYNRKLAELMTQKVSDIKSPSGKTVSFVAKRGSFGVYMALSDPNFDLSRVRNGVYSSGKAAYRKDVIDKMEVRK